MVVPVKTALQVAPAQVTGVLALVEIVVWFPTGEDPPGPIWLPTTWRPASRAPAGGCG